jgi:hypothetical protein
VCIYSHTGGKTPPRAFTHASAAHNDVIAAFAKEVYVRRFSDSIRTERRHFHLYKYGAEITKRSI